MSINDPFNGKAEDEEQFKIPVTDKRRVTEDGLREDVTEDAPKQSQKSALENELESKLKAEIERREAAEAKLVGVQSKFEEAKSNLEKETAEMRSRLMKTLEDRAKALVREGPMPYRSEIAGVLARLLRLNLPPHFADWPAARI